MTKKNEIISYRLKRVMILLWNITKIKNQSSVRKYRSYAYFESTYSANDLLLVYFLALQKTLGTKVIISKGAKKGKIEIEYYSDEELSRIIELISMN